MSTIISLKVERVKRLKAVTITPTGATVIVGGKNGAGKSSVLDSIAYALAGTSAIPGEPIHRGETSAKVVLETQELIVTRKWTANGTTLEVSNKDGLKFPSPQAVLDKLCAAVAFDPLAFVRLGGTTEGRRAQLKQLRDLVGIDTSKLDATRAEVFAARTDVNRRIAQQEAVVNSLPATGPEAVDVAELLKRLDAGQKVNKAKEEALRVAEQMEKKANDVVETLQSRRQIVERLEAELVKAKQDVAETIKASMTADNLADMAQDNLEQLPLMDLAPIRADMESATRRNFLAAKVAQRKEEETKEAALVKQADVMTAHLTSIDAERLALITSAKFPIPALGFSESEVTLNSLPLNQASSAEQLRVGLGIAIAMNPKLKVMLIRDGSLLDSDSLKIVADMAEKSGSQVWLERVGDDGNCTVVIEDGEVAQ